MISKKRTAPVSIMYSKTVWERLLEGGAGTDRVSMDKRNCISGSFIRTEVHEIKAIPLTFRGGL
jgi:hypothetical protein